ncbi:MAG: protein translocase subunit SecD [Gammaproteobacteria bacterium]|jgi:preprotein translocase subunit SecD|nr:protein translocase subunit SecD [Gammaproteobacteria bacterium]
MLNKYPLWKHLLIVVITVAGLLYALPNLYGEDPAVQVSASARGVEVDEGTLAQVVGVLERAGVSVKSVRFEEGLLLARFTDTETQLQAAERIKEGLGSGHVVALNLAPGTPDWLRALDAAPMYLGLDLRGGVHFLMEVDMQAAVRQAEENVVNDLRLLMRDNRIRYRTVTRSSDGVRVRFADASPLDEAQRLIEREFPALVVETSVDDEPQLLASLSEDEAEAIRKFALQQNITTLRNRVNELGVAEPVIQQQGTNRIVVQLPGVQDTARAKEILGATATLEYRLADTEHDVRSVVESGRIPVNAKLYYERNGQPILLKKQIIVTGDQIVDAASTIDENGGPAVTVRLDGNGGRRMSKITRDNIGKPMAVVFIENRTDTKLVDGEPVRTTKRTEEVISVATIRDHFSNRFQTTGLDSTEEARDLALLLRAGALATPIEIVEERTVGPSLGRDNIDQGFAAVMLGFALVLVFMALYYRVFGLVADLALAMNLVLLVAVLSLLQATLTLPGIAGIVLTVGMAVDANVLIFERIREELRAGGTPQASIHSGYEKALSTIADANITTLIAAVVLFSFGTGPIKGFAVTLSIGIVTSMFTAIMGTRAVINLIYGGRRVERLAI